MGSMDILVPSPTAAVQGGRHEQRRSTCSHSTDIPVQRRADNILKKFGWATQQKLEHISDEYLQKNDGVNRILAALDAVRGDREGMTSIECQTL